MSPQLWPPVPEPQRPFAAGTYTHNASIPMNGGTGQRTVNFPAGRFSKPPKVTVAIDSGRLSPWYYDVTTSGMKVGADNWSNAAAGAPPYHIDWTATEY